MILSKVRFVCDVNKWFFNKRFRIQRTCKPVVVGRPSSSSSSQPPPSSALLTRNDHAYCMLSRTFERENGHFKKNSLLPRTAHNRTMFTYHQQRTAFSYPSLPVFSTHPHTELLCCFFSYSHIPTRRHISQDNEGENFHEHDFVIKGD